MNSVNLHTWALVLMTRVGVPSVAMALALVSIFGPGVRGVEHFSGVAALFGSGWGGATLCCKGCWP